MKYHALLVMFEKAAKFENCRLLQIIDGALRVKKRITKAGNACLIDIFYTGIKIDSNISSAYSCL